MVVKIKSQKPKDIPLTFDLEILSSKKKLI